MDLVPGRFEEEEDHPSAAKREEIIRHEISRILDQEEIYERAMDRMARAREVTTATPADRSSILEAEALYRSAIRDLETFRVFFDGRRVLSNLAAAHLRIASGRLLYCDGSLGIRYRLDAVVDEGALVHRSVHRGADDAFDRCAGSQYAAAVEEAIMLLEASVARAPTYFKGQSNLGMAFFLDRQTAGAKRQAEILLRLAPDDPRAHELDLLADLLAADLGNRRLSRKVILDELGALRERFPEDPSIAFNLASALTYDPEHGLDEALPVWRDFLRLEPEGPWAAIARDWVGLDEPADPAEADQPAR
jgi:tetratricopeptide (TPR) repeat protein